MLTKETARRIQSARDILVGQLPLPSDQVELITIALIYKFMDDIDEQSRELGGKATFFVGALRDLCWRKLISNTLSAEERVTKFTQGIDAVSDPKHNHIPELFKSIFKNAFLKFRDGPTLKLFLDEINGFTYDHSEELGNAFEVLLSAMGTQGENGQFRTPRHIIEFIVDVVDPQKEDTILDPACGTAGFLISAYKHILAANTSPKAAEKDRHAGDLLKGAQREKLTHNIAGYDITPLMCRLSRVNMYLHHFPNPVIHEYDTLTNKNRWDEKADVILANPPFMTPKGGIRPHDRFAISANRSEVLFVDYIAEHLNPGGRAGIIVPEGIIFQSQNAYKDLRRMLLDGYLWAVVSFPGGVFNPYSGVKTSVLFLDRALARRADDVFFVKVESDGFDLGAQRRPLEQNDLPEALRALQQRKKALMETERRGPKNVLRERPRPYHTHAANSHPVAREKILESPDINLSGDRYLAVAVRGTGQLPMMKLAELCLEIKSGFACGKSEVNGSGVPHLRPMNITTDGQFVWEGTKFISEEEFVGNAEYSLKAGDVLFNNTNSKELVGKTCYITTDIRGGFSNHLTRLRPDTKKMLPKLLAILLHEMWRRGVFQNLCNKWIGQAGVNNTILATVEIPVPPLAEQARLVAELEGYRRVIESARQILAHYKPHIPINSDWPTAKLGDVCVIKSGGTPDRSNKSYWGGDIPWVTTTLIDYDVIHKANEFITVKGLENSSTWIVPKHTVLMAMYGQGVTRGRVAVLGIDAAINQACAAFQIRNKTLLSEFLFRILQSRYEDLRSISDARGGNQSNLSAQVLKQYSIPLPPIGTQKQIVAELEAERSLVESNRELAARFETKLQQALAAIWGETK